MARTPKTTPRSPSKSGTKKPRETVVADARGGKTTSVCEASVEGSDADIDLRRRELAALEESNRLKRQAEYRRRNEAIGFTPLIGPPPALPPMDDGETAILRLLALSPDGGATYDAIDRDQGPQDCQPYTTTRLRWLHQRGYIEHEPLHTREKPAAPADRAAWRDELHTAFRASTWRVTEKGIERAKRLGATASPADEQNVGARPTQERLRTVKAHQLYGQLNSGGMSTDTFASIRKAAGLDLGLRGHNVTNQEFTRSELQRLIDELDSGRYTAATRARADKWSALLANLDEY